MGRFPIEVASLGRKIELLSKRVVDVSIPSHGENVFSIFKGGGLEFRDFKEYSPGDDSRHIDWKASLKSDSLLVKEYIQESGLDVIFIYDVSESMLFGSQKKVKAHYGAEFILTMSATLMEMGYNVGFLCFNDKLKNKISPAASDRQFGVLFEVLSSYSTYGGGFSIAPALDFIEESYSKGSVIIFVSDFLDFEMPSVETQKKFKKIALKYDFI